MASRVTKDQSDSEKCASVFRALSDETRLRILLMLEARPRSVNEIVDFFLLTQPTISRHLFVLKKAGLVNVERQGQKKIYSLNESALRNDAFDYFLQFHCCSSSKRRK
ncbi:MAG: metalloregulator ArsR/SmtB family transcription factor [candidate division Zixibacteria bacterium]|nr:metalloregulator ArsR/SmtB family transcription factor [candidate division Zixibacteria bacterium]MBU1470798.1 metalloregulator ArsR/SmtB family transcription factor [candidate division Zixibacteria bacterium]MBU2625321.1 metalloregulator ArsR/SmtB family transcription factor [candidate division Zixibacteria bacterium]